MKIFISADLEGVNGVVSPGDIIPGEPGYEGARVLMTEEVNTVINGAFQGGADQVIVCDSHEVAQNIRFDLLDERAELISGASRADSMVHGIDGSFDGLILLGHHAKFGTQNAVLDHTYDQYLIRDMRINGISYGEAGINALYACEQDVPLIMTTGDDALYQEVKDFDEDVKTVVVKQAEGRYCARCLSKKECHQRLLETARKAVEGAGAKKCVYVPEAPTLEITFQQVCMADGAMRVGGTKRISAMTISYAYESMKELMEMRQVITQAAAEFYDKRF